MQRIEACLSTAFVEFLAAGLVTTAESNQILNYGGIS